MTDRSAPETQHLFKPIQERQRADSFRRTVRGPFVAKDPFLLSYLEGVDQKDSKEVRLDESVTETGELLFDLDTKVEIQDIAEKVYSPNTPDDYKLAVVIPYQGRRVAASLTKGDLFRIPAGNPAQLNLERQIPEWVVNNEKSFTVPIYNPLQFYTTEPTKEAEKERKESGIDNRASLRDIKTNGHAVLRVNGTWREFKKPDSNYYWKVYIEEADDPSLVGMFGYASKGGIYQAERDLPAEAINF